MAELRSDEGQTEAVPADGGMEVLRRERDYWRNRALGLVESNIAPSALLAAEVTANLPGALFQFREHPTEGYSFQFLSGALLNSLAGAGVPLQPADLIAQIHPDDLADVWTQAQRARELLQPYRLEFRLMRPGGGVVWLQVSATPARFADGAYCWTGVALDITEKKRVDGLLADTEQRCRTIIENYSAGPLLLFDTQFRCLYCGGQRLDELGLPPELIVGRTITEADCPEWASAVTRLLERARDGVRSREEVQCRGRIFDTAAVPICDAAGTCTEILLIGLDFTDRKQALARLRQRETYLHALNQARGTLLEADDQIPWQEFVEAIGPASGASRAYVLLVEYLSTDELVLRYTSEWCAEGIEAFLHRPGFERQVFDRDMVTFFEPLSRGFAVARHVRQFPPSAQPILRAQQIASVLALPLTVKGTLIGIVGFDHCFAERQWEPAEEAFLRSAAENLSHGVARVQMMHELRASESRFRLLLDGMPTVAIQGYRADGRVCYWNRASEELYGYTAEEALGESLLDLIIPESMREVVRGVLRDAVAGGAMPPPEEIRLKHKDGTLVPVLSSHIVVEEEPGQAIFFCCDVDLRRTRQTEEALRESEERLRLALDAARDGVWDWDLKTLEFRSSATLSRLYGRDSYSDALTWEDILETLEHEDIPSVMTALSEHIQGRTERYEAEMRFRLPDGSIRWLQDRGKVVSWDEQGYPKRLIGVSSDITERKQAEAERLEFARQILEAQKMESLGVLAGGIAHDFNNILMAILGHAELAALELPHDARLSSHLSEIGRAARRAAELCRQMLAYSGKEHRRKEPVDLSDRVQEMLHLLESSISKKIAIEGRLDAKLPPIQADPAQLTQVILNLVINAAESIGDRPGLVTILTSTEHCTAETLQRSLFPDKPPPGEFVCLEVADNGCGMNEEVLARLFEPFFSTKFTGRGLGMSAVHGIVRGHRGALFCESIEGAGTTFRVLFPCDAEMQDVTPVPW